MIDLSEERKKRREAKRLAKQKERRLLVIKKMLPHFFVMLFAFTILLMYNILNRPFLTDNNTFLDQGRCVSVEREWNSERKKRWSIYHISLENGNNYQVRNQDVGEFEREEFVNAHSYKSFIIRYGVNVFTNEKYAVDIQDTEGGKYLELKDVNLQILLEWGMSIFLYPIPTIWCSVLCLIARWASMPRKRIGKST